MCSIISDSRTEEKPKEGRRCREGEGDEEGGEEVFQIGAEGKRRIWTGGDFKMGRNEPLMLWLGTDNHSRSPALQ